LYATVLFFQTPILATRSSAYVHERLNQAQQVNESIRDEQDDHVVGELEIILIALYHNGFDAGSDFAKSVRNVK
jgi:hypothetical protein